MNILVSLSASEYVNQTFFTENVKQRLEKSGTVRYGTFTPEELKENLAGVDILYGNWGTPCLDDGMLANANQLKLVCYTGGSVAGLMSEALPNRGITVLCGNKVFADSVAEGTIAYILLAQRRLVKLINETASNGWAPFYHSDGLRNKTVGLIGFGMIVKSLVKLLSVFGCKVKICSEYFHKEDETLYGAEKCEMDEIFSTCDIVSLHESLRDDTYHLIGSRYFDQMKQGALFVNTARGAIIVEEDLAKAAKAGKIRAILDVFEQEPLAMDSCLRGCEDIILIPHRAGPTIDAREYVTLELIEDMNRFIAGETGLKHEISLEYAKHMTGAVSAHKKA